MVDMWSERRALGSGGSGDWIVRRRGQEGFVFLRFGPRRFGVYSDAADDLGEGIVGRHACVLTSVWLVFYCGGGGRVMS